MRQAPWLAALAFVLAHAVACSAQINFGKDFDAALEKAKKDKKPVLVHFTKMNSPGCLQLIKMVFSNPQIADFVSQKFVAVRASADDEKGRKVFETYKIDTVPTVLILDQQGQELLHEQYLNANDFGKFLTTGLEIQSALDALARVKKDSPAALVAALKKVGEVKGVRSRKILREYAENDKLHDSVRSTALEGLATQKDAIGDLVPFLGEKSQRLRTVAFNLLKTAGAPALPALLDGLDGYTPEQRASCFALASALTMNAKISKDANFWRTGSAEDRQAAVKAWKDWYEKNKPNM